MTGAGEKVSGTTFSLVANATSEGKFVGWVDDVTGATVATTTYLNGTATADASYTAVFTNKYSTVTIASNNTAWGTVSGGGKKEVGTTANIVATPKTGYYFVRWSDNNTSATRSVTWVQSDQSFTATFAAQYAVRLVPTNDAGSTGSDCHYGQAVIKVNGSNAASRYINPGASVTLSITPDSERRFIGWFLDRYNGLLISAANSATYTPAGDCTIVPVFGSIIVTPSADGANGRAGVVGQSRWGVAITFALTDSFSVQAQCTRDGWSFLRWEDGSGNVLGAANPLQGYAGNLAPDINHPFVAVFHVDGVHLVVAVKAGQESVGSASVLLDGVASGTSADVPFGSVGRIVASVNPGATMEYDGAQVEAVFSHWEREGQSVPDFGADAEAVGADNTLVADFEYVAVFGPRIPCRVEFRVQTAAGEEVAGASLSPSRAADAPDGEGGAKRWYPGAISVSPAGIPAGFHVSAWRVDSWNGEEYVPGVPVSEGSEGFSADAFDFTISGERVRVVAIVARNVYDVSWSVDGPSETHGVVSAAVDGTPAPGGTAQVAHGSSIVFTATPGDSATAFRGFFADGEQIPSQGATLSVPSVTGPLSVVAKFGGTVTASANPPNMGDAANVRVAGGAYGVSCDFTFGDTVEAKAAPAQGRYFARWTSDSAQTAAWGAEASFVPEAPEVALSAMFSDSPPEFFFTLTHGEVVGQGELRLSAAGDGVAVENVTGKPVELSTTHEEGGMQVHDTLTLDDTPETVQGKTYTTAAEKFAAIVHDRVGGLQMESESGASAGEGGDLAAVDPDAPSYWRVAGSGLVMAEYQRSALATLEFKRWAFTPLDAAMDDNVGQEVFAEQDEERMGTANPMLFAPTRHGVIRAVYGGSGTGPATLRRLDDLGKGAGALSFWPAGANPSTDAAGNCSAFFQSGAQVVAVAAPSNGYRFAGWYEAPNDEEPVSTAATLSFEMTDEAGGVTYYARFAKDSSSLFAFDAGTENKQFVWRSLRFKNARPFNPSCCRVCADGPAWLTVRMASSPEAPASEWDSATQSVQFDGPVAKRRQDMRRMRPMRPEKYVELEVRAAHRVAMLSLATSMDTLE